MVWLYQGIVFEEQNQNDAKGTSLPTFVCTQT